jgi:hypothetical protein
MRRGRRCGGRGSRGVVVVPDRDGNPDHDGHRDEGCSGDRPPAPACRTRHGDQFSLALGAPGSVARLLAIGTIDTLAVLTARVAVGAPGTVLTTCQTEGSASCPASGVTAGRVAAGVR